MSYPATVTSFHQVKNKGGRPRKSGPTIREHDGHSDNDEEVGTGARASGAGTGKGVDKGLGGVELSFGQEGSAKVEKGSRVWKWGFVSESQDDLKLGLGSPSALFPPSRETPITTQSEPPTNSQSLEYVRQICDKYEHLGLDDLVTAELEHQADILGKESKGGYDPYVGKRMVYARIGHAKLGKNLVLFPAGELGNHLYIATLLGDSNKSSKATKLTRFIIGSTPAEKYPTPILQIVHSSVTSPHREDLHATSLIIRQHSSVIIYRLTPDQSFSPSHLSVGASAGLPVKLTKIGEIRNEDLGGKRPMDIVMDSTEWGKAVVVDEAGGVWIWGWKRVTLGAKGESGMVLTNIRPAIKQDRDQFHRIAFGTQQGTILVVSSSQAVVIDIENPSYPTTTILSLGPERQFVALDTTAHSRQAVYTCLATTREILWMDESKPGDAPVLSWKHEFSEVGLRDLEITHIRQEDSDCFILSSKSNPTLLIFHLSSHPPLRSLHTPYTFQLDLESRLRPLSDLVILDRHTELPQLDEQALSLLAISTDGGLWSAPIAPHAETQDDGTTDLRVVWDAELQVRSNEGLGNGRHEGQAGETRFTIMDARWAWLAINKEVVHDEDDPIFSAKLFERHIRELDAPFDHFVTAAELARDAMLAEGEPRRSHIVRQLPIDQLDPEEIARLSNINLERDLHLVSHQPISPAAIDGHLNTDSPSLDRVDTIRQALGVAFPLRADTTSSKSRHRRCLDALAIDLAFSTAVLSSEAIPSISTDPPPVADTDDDVLARAAGLTLTDSGPPGVEFTVLLPKVNDGSGQAGEEGNDIEDEEEDAEAVEPNPRLESLQDLSVRSLLAEWRPGTGVSEYQWKPWVNTGTEGPSSTNNLSISIPNSSSLGTSRPIRPLPSSPRPNSPRHHPSPSTNNGQQPFFSQPVSSNRYAPPVVQSQTTPQGTGIPWYQPIPKKGGMAVPVMMPSGFNSRGSSPVGGVSGSRAREGGESYGESQETMWGAATQVERGPFGGRVGEGKKKKAKKRVGGF